MTQENKVAEQPIKSKEEAADSYVANELSPYNSRIKENGRKDFLAGWDAASKQVGNVWVKASERLPDKSGVYFVKIEKFNAGARLLYSIELGWMYDERRTILRDDFPTFWLDESATPSLAEENRRLREAAKELLHLHSCEQEGLQSGKPTFEMWFNAVNKLSEALDGDAGNKEETK